ncbi:MAG TPA: phage/plasmid primase, P4 family, partial [Anaerolineae bacterium]|nr:phage/plasmid primase, P4 family [Anaerolineae bacterium]
KEYKKVAERLGWRARALRKRKGVNNTLFFFESLTAKNGDFWDCDNDLLAVENGVVDLRTGKLRNGRPTDYMRLYAPTEWRGVDEPAPRWDTFINEVMGDDEETGAYLLRLLGYAISGHTIEHKLPFFIGDEGSNGKSKLFNALRSVLGDSNSGYVRMLNKEVILKSRANDGGASPHIHMMRGARLGLLSETSEGERLDLGQMKQITGGDAITSRKLYGDPVTWENHCQLLMVTNHLPHGDADDSASWRRLTVIPFEQKFVENPKPNTNERKMDKRLDEVLRAEASGILAALVRAGIEWRATGLQPSKAARARVRAYRMQEDTLQTFIDDCLVISGDDSFIEARDIYKTYATWSKEGGMKAMSSNAFGRKFGKRFERQRPSGVTVYLGVKLKALGRDILAAAEAGKGGGMVTTAEDDEQTNVSFPPTSLSSPVNTTVGESKPIVAISS